MGRLQTTTSLGRFRWPGSGFRALGLWGLGFRVYSRLLVYYLANEGVTGCVFMIVLRSYGPLAPGTPLEALVLRTSTLPAWTLGLRKSWEA